MLGKPISMLKAATAYKSIEESAESKERLSKGVTPKKRN
jgi:hypothetical protein